MAQYGAAPSSHSLTATRRVGVGGHSYTNRVDIGTKFCNMVIPIRILCAQCVALLRGFLKKKEKAI